MTSDPMASVCRRGPREGDELGATCPECPHAIGSHAEDYCPLCAIIAQADAITTAIGAHAGAVTRELAASMASVLGTIAMHMASAGEALGNALRPRKAAYCPGGLVFTGMDYSRPEHPRRVHQDGSLCDHHGPIRIGDAP